MQLPENISKIVADEAKSKHVAQCRLDAAFKLFEAAAILGDVLKVERQRNTIHALQMAERIILVAASTNIAKRYIDFHHLPRTKCSIATTASDEMYTRGLKSAQAIVLNEEDCRKDLLWLIKARCKFSNFNLEFQNV